MTDKTPEALEVVQQLDRIFKSEVQDYDVILDAASVLRRQHQRIEELEKALQEIAEEVGPSLGSNFGSMSRIGRIARALLSTTKQEDSQA